MAHYRRWQTKGDIDPDRPLRAFKDLPAAFWAKVEKGTPDECWHWLGSTREGYGLIKFAGQVRNAHRVAYELQVGPIPDGLHIDHLCRNRLCVNAAHLEPVTQAENNRRARMAQAR